jgi:hypothetical protein
VSRGTGVFVCLFGPENKGIWPSLLRRWDTGVCWWSALSTLAWRASDFAGAFELEPAAQGRHSLSPRAGGSAEELGDGVLQLVTTGVGCLGTLSALSLTQSADGRLSVAEVRVAVLAWSMGGWSMALAYLVTFA